MAFDFVNHPLEANAECMPMICLDKPDGFI